MDGSSWHGQQHVTEVLLPITGAPRQARDVVTLACLSWDLPRMVPAAAQVVSELISNAVVHAGTIIDLTVARDQSTVMIMVGDGDPSALSTTRPGGNKQPWDPRNGIGLLIVDAMASRWGWHHVAGGKVVWAALDLDR